MSSDNCSLASVATGSLHSVAGASPTWNCFCCREDPEYFGEKRCSSAHYPTEEELLYVPTDDHRTPPNAFYLPLTFIPDFIIEEVLNDTFRTLPYVLKTRTVLLMADVCNFTSLTEKYSRKGIAGIEEIARLLNNYMSTLASMLIAFGGDILNFAGDAFLVQWEEPGHHTDFDLMVQQAYSCAVSIQSHRFFKEKSLERLLQVKIGIAQGDIVTRVLGSPSEFLIFLVAGPTVPIVAAAEEMCKAGEIIVSSRVYETLQRKGLNTYNAEVLLNGFVRITGYPDDLLGECYVPDRCQTFRRCDKQHVAMSRAFLIPAIRDVKTRQELNYLSELTMVTILFILMQNVDAEDEDCDLIDRSFGVVLASVKKMGGAINKMLLFDKGCTVLAVFGLPGMKQANDPARALLCAADLIQKLGHIGLIANIGVTSGTCYCGIVGHPQRQEYTVIGSRVNLASRIMVNYSDESIALDIDTFNLSRKELGDDNFTELEARYMKGIDRVGQVYAFKLSNYRKTSTSSTESLPDEHIIVEKEEEKHRIQYCLNTLKNNEFCSVETKSLLPVVVIEGSCGKGKSYLLYHACEMAHTMDFQILACCTIPSYINEPFSTVASLIQYWLKFTFYEKQFDREQSLLKYIPLEDQSQVFLLNHLFQVQFNEPKGVITDKVYRDNETDRLLKIIFQQLNKKSPILLAIQNANFMDEESWRLIKELVEVDRILVFMTIPSNFKEPTFASSVLLLKSFCHITLGKSVGDFFSSYVCWFLGVAAMHKDIISFVKLHSRGNAQLLEEILLTEKFFAAFTLVKFCEMPSSKLMHEFYVADLHAMTEDEKTSALVCDIKEDFNLNDVVVAKHVHDAMKERLNKMSIQHRLLLKRAAVLGHDFDQTSLEAVSPEMTKEEVAASINSLLSKDILLSLCNKEVYLDVPVHKKPHIKISVHNTCFCAQVLKKSPLIRLPLQRKVSPFNHLQFRDDIIRSTIIAHMTKEQLLSMHLEIADFLKLKSYICMPFFYDESPVLKTDPGEPCSHPVRVLTVDQDMCIYMKKRPKVLALVSALYKNVGMRYLPMLYLRKAAQFSIYCNYPVQALNYLYETEKCFAKDWNFEQKNALKEEKHFNPMVLKASIKVTKSEALLQLGSSYEAAAQSFDALDMLGLDSMDLFGALKFDEFPKFLAKCSPLHCRAVIKCISAISKAYMMANEYTSALNVIKTEYIALDAYPISFYRELKHMIAFYECNHKLNHKRKQYTLEMNMFKYCHERLRTCNTPLDIIEINCVGSAYVSAIETNLNKNDFLRSELLANEASLILRCVRDLKTMPHILVLLSEIYYHQNKHFDSFVALSHMQEAAQDSGSFTYHALLCCGLARLFDPTNSAPSWCGVTRKLKPNEKFDVPQKYVNDCNTFIIEWHRNHSTSLRRNLAFYITTRFALWCLISKIPKAQELFNGFFEVSEHLQLTASQDSYWHVFAHINMLRLRTIVLVRDETNSEILISRKQDLLQKMKKLEKKVKKYFPVLKKECRRVKKAIRSLKLAHVKK